MRFVYVCISCLAGAFTQICAHDLALSANNSDEGRQTELSNGRMFRFALEFCHSCKVFTQVYTRGQKFAETPNPLHANRPHDSISWQYFPRVCCWCWVLSVTPLCHTSFSGNPALLSPHPQRRKHLLTVFLLKGHKLLLLDSTHDQSFCPKTRKILGEQALKNTKAHKSSDGGEKYTTVR